MSSAQLQIIKEQLEYRGFFVEENYRYLVYDEEINKTSSYNVDIAAFARKYQRDMSTISIVAQTFPEMPTGNPFLHVNRYLAPNIQLAIVGDNIQWWMSSSLHNPIYITNLKLISNDFIRYKVSPDEMLKARLGFQESLFTLLPNALEFAREATAKAVTERFNEALHEVINKNHVRELTAVGIDLLTALILDDKRAEIAVYKESVPVSNGHEAIARAKQYFPLSFRDTPDVSEEVLSIFWKHLRTDMTYRSMTPDDLSDLLSSLYEGVLLTKDKRRFQGSYYTPRNLAVRILQSMPIEELDPDERIVLDGACGSGNLLRAASKRLEDALTTDISPEERADFLSASLMGIDQDAFAVNIARRALLLANLPHDREWKIETADFRFVELSRQPSVIIANPPFKGVKGWGGGEYAVEFLTKYLEILKPDGLLGIILPAPILQNPFEAQIRRDLLEHCAILELWLLPEKAIPSSKLGIAVLILQKLGVKSKSFGQLTRVFIMHDLIAMEEFLKGEAVSLSFTVDLYRNHFYSANLLPSILGDLWARLDRTMRPLIEYGYEVHNGIQGNAEQFSNYPIEGWRPCLSYASALEPYLINWEAQADQKYVDYPGQLRFPRDASHFEVQKKVVIQGARNPRNPWRLIAAIEDRHLVIKENFHYIIRPLNGILSEEAIVAILNSKFANAWYSEHDVQFNVQNVIIEHLPIPNFSAEDLEALNTLASKISALKASIRQGDLYAMADIRYLTSQIDDLLYRSYGLLEDEIQLLGELMQRAQRPGSEWAQAPAQSVGLTPLSFAGNEYYCIGEVADVNRDKLVITVDLPGLARSRLRFPIPPTIPGWALRSGVTFEAKLPAIQAKFVSELSEAHNSDDVLDIIRLDLFDIRLSHIAYVNETQLLNYIASGGELS
jgi:type I restriction-modification system DNA methylase subunit